MRVRVRGADKHLARLKAMRSPASRDQIGAALFAGADKIKADAQNSITEGSISGPGHIASLPGEPPNADTRVLDRNIEATRTGQLSAQVASRAKYSAALEYGTSKMKARPFMKPAVVKNRDYVAKLVADAVKAVVRKSGS